MNLIHFVGQEDVKRNLNLLIQATLSGREFPHIGLYGPPGSGKTTLAEIIAKELNAELIYINGSAVISPNIFRAPIAKAIKNSGKNKRYIVMVDECHAMHKKVQSSLLSLLEKPSVLCTVLEKNQKLPDGRTLKKGDILREKLPEKVSFIFATTDKAELSDALDGRLHPIHLQEYTIVEKMLATKNYLQKNNVMVEEDDYLLIGSTAKNMRHLIKICERMIDYSCSKGRIVLSHNDVEEVLTILGLDENGCDVNDRKYLEYVKANAPVSLSNIARFINVDEKEVKEKIEPFLIRKGWVTIGGRGRSITQLGFKEFFKNITDAEFIMDILNA